MIYETEDDLRREQETIRIWGKELFPRGKATKLPRSMPCDFSIHNGECIVGLAEVKVRNNKSSDYKTAWMDILKVHLLRTISDEFHFSGWLIWHWLEDDVITYLDITKMNLYELEPDHAKRYDRNDPADRDLVLTLPLRMMNRIRIKDR